MNMIVLSDSHRHIDNINKIKSKLLNCDYLVHVGDCVEDAKYIQNMRKGICCVKGNSDYLTDVPFEKLIDVNGNKIFLTHGHKYHVKISLERLKFAAQANGANIVLYGHTHTPKIIYNDGIMFINPGSVCGNRDGSGASYAEINFIDHEVYPVIEHI